jgi:hypothetical protein
MVADTALSTAVRTHLANSTAHLTRFTTAWSTSLATAAAEFNLAPDHWIDVKRIPATVTDLDTLVAYLRTLRDEISNPRPDTQSSGRLKLYKLMICMIHALDSYVSSGPNFSVTASVFCAAALEHGRLNVPAGLSDNGQKMWTATFEAGNVRAQHCMAVLVSFGDTAAKSSQPPARTP